MTSQHLTSWAIELEALGHYQAAAEVRARIAAAESVVVGRAARDAEASGDWRRWADLLASCPAAA